VPPHVATPHALRTHAQDQPGSDLYRSFLPAGRSGRLRSGLFVGATSVALTFTVLPGTAAAEPGEATTPEQATQMVAEASHELEVVTEELNTAKVLLDEQEAAAAAADQAAADAREQLASLDGQIRQLAHSAYTSDGLTHLDVLLTSDSAEDFLAQLNTLDAIAGHTNDVLADVSAAADAADEAQAEADAAATEAQKAFDEIAAQQADLEDQIADYQAQYDALTAAQQEEVVTAHAGEAVAPAAIPSGVIAPSAAAQAAVDTALAQVGDPYVWGAGGPDAFDCSGLTQYAYSTGGVALPHSSSMQSSMGASVSTGDLQPGDLLFYYSPTSHVAMYIGNGQMVHASTAGSPVKVVAFDSMSGFTHARRIAG
jgi:cell wall-associated NlpC family hydrolase